MSKHRYDAGCLNLPFVGISTFGKFPYLENCDAINADAAILGASYDLGNADIVHTDTINSQKNIEYGVKKCRPITVPF